MTSTRTDAELRMRAEQREQVLAEAAAYLTSSLPPDEVLRKLPHLLVPGFAEWASVVLKTGHDTYVRVHLHPDAADGIAAVIRTGRSELCGPMQEELFESVRDRGVSTVAKVAQFRSAVLVPLFMQGEVAGAVTAGSSEPDAFGPQDLVFLERFAHLAGISVQTGAMFAELRSREERLNVALEAAPIFIFGQDRDLRYTWVQGTGTGFTLERVLEHTDEELFPPDEAAHITMAKRRAMETRARTRDEVRVLFAGEPRAFDVTVEPCMGENGEPLVLPVQPMM